VIDPRNQEKKEYLLYDYSSGGISFICDKVFFIGSAITCIVKREVENQSKFHLL
jgi:hypothetical protein